MKNNRYDALKKILKLQIKNILFRTICIIMKKITFANS